MTRAVQVPCQRVLTARSKELRVPPRLGQLMAVLGSFQKLGTSRRTALLLADAEGGENLAEEIVACELARELA